VRARSFTEGIGRVEDFWCAHTLQQALELAFPSFHHLISFLVFTRKLHSRTAIDSEGELRRGTRCVTTEPFAAAQ
jgi:hypothetical protein